jgi:hypothetical protein
MECPPFFFHYIILIVCVSFITCVCILKFNYLFWYSQPITFCFTLRRWYKEGRGQGNWQTSIMNPLSLGERYNNAVIYSFVHHVNHDNVTVYGNRGFSIEDAPYQEIASFLSRRENELEVPGRRNCLPNHGDFMSISQDKLEYILSQGTHGLSVFIGIYSNKQRSNNIKGVSILTPRIMLSFSVTKSDPPRSVSIYVCEHLAWTKYVTLERESLELIETTEYIQKFREIAGEQTLYKYNEIPWFVIPFTTINTYTFMNTSGMSSETSRNLDDGMSVIRVSSANFALFYSFVNECSRDFRCCIWNELTQLQSLVQGGIYQIYMLLLNNIRVVAVYIFESSWMKVKPVTPLNAKPRPQSKKTRGNRISALHDYISRTSTAVVKYLPPVMIPKYDIMGRRIKNTTTTNDENHGSDGKNTSELSSEDIILLKSSIRDKTICENDLFVRGFMASVYDMIRTNGSTNSAYVSIDTLAHNDIIVDIIKGKYSSSWKMLSSYKWYYILYNAIIHQEIMCKDVCII